MFLIELDDFLAAGLAIRRIEGHNLEMLKENSEILDRLQTLKKARLE